MNNDRNLLFGIFAIQLRKATSADLLDVAGAWALDPSRDISQRLIDAKVIDEADRHVINEYVDRAIDAHSGDPNAALNSIQSAHHLQAAIVSLQDSLEATPSPDVTRRSPERWLDLGYVEAVPAVDETPGRYTQQSEYARGGIGRVLLVHDQYLSREIAMKELLPIVSVHDTTLNALEPTPVQASISMVSRFLQEARITGQLEHPSIVPVYELGRRPDGTVYYTMKLVRGRTLTQAFQEARTLRERLDLLPHIIDLCHAVGYAHSRNVIHRDIKPSNVMIGEFGETVVLDWGLAKVRGKEDVHASQIEHTLRTLRIKQGGAAVQTADGVVLGTPVFMPPEQARGDLKNVTERSDVYSLGAVLYTMLAGQFPYGGKTPSDVLDQVLNQDPEPIESIEPDVPPELVAICRRAMARDPQKRYANGKELAEELSRFQTGALVSAYSYGFQEHFWRFVRRHKALITTAAVFLVILAAVGAYSYVRVSHERNVAIEARDEEREQRIVAAEARDREREQREVAEQQLYLASVLLAQDQIEERRYDLAAETLERAPAAYRNWEWEYLGRLGHGDAWTFTGHELAVEDVAIVPSSGIALSGSNDGTVRVLDADSGQELRVLDRFDGWMSYLPISADGTRALVITSNGPPRLWNLETMERLTTLDRHPDEVMSARFSPDGLWVVSGSADGTIHVWSATTGEIASTIETGNRLRDVVFNPNAQLLTAVGTGHSISVREVETGNEIAALALPESYPDKVSFSPDGQWLAVTHKGNVTIWQCSDFSLATTLPDHGTTIVNALFSPDSSVLATGGIDGTIRLWRPSDGWATSVTMSHDDAVTDLEFLQTPLRLVSASIDHTIRIWDTATGEEVRRFEGHSGPVRQIATSADGLSVLSGSDDGTVKHWRLSTSSTVSEQLLTGHTERIQSLERRPASEQLLSVSEDGSARVWSVVSGEQQLFFESPRGEISCGTWSPDGLVIATGTNSHLVYTWETSTGNLGLTLDAHDRPVSGVYFNPSGLQLLSISWDETGILWDLRTGSEVYTFEAPEGRWGVAAFRPDGSLIAVPADGYAVGLRDANSGSMTDRLEGHSDRVNAVNFSPNGSRLLTISRDATGRIWDMETRTLKSTLAGHENSVEDGAFSPDGNLVLTASTDGTARLWNAESGTQLHVLEGHGAAVSAVEFLNNDRAITASYDGTTRIWDVHTGDTLLILPQQSKTVEPVVCRGDGWFAAGAIDGGIFLWTK